MPTIEDWKATYPSNPDSLIEQIKVEDSPARVRVQCWGREFTVDKDRFVAREDLELASDVAWQLMGASLAKHLRDLHRTHKERERHGG